MSTNILGNIGNTLKNYSPDAIVAFMGVNYFGHSVQQMANGLDVPADTIYDWLALIRSDVRRIFIREGGRISDDGATVAGLGDAVVPKMYQTYGNTDGIDDDDNT